MSDVDDTDGRDGHDDVDFTSKVIPIADARMRLEQLEPRGRHCRTRPSLRAVLHTTGQSPTSAFFG
jgi:hypothetical protein